MLNRISDKKTKNTNTTGKPSGTRAIGRTAAQTAGSGTRKRAVKPVIVVGGGPSGIRITQELARAGRRVVLFNAERWAPYNRVKLTPLLSGDVQLGRIFQEPDFFEAARGMANLGADTWVVEHETHLMPRQLDLAAGTLLAAQIVNLGITVRTGHRVLAIGGDERVEWIELSSGEKVACDSVIVCTGVMPNIEMARDAGLAVNRAIRVTCPLHNWVLDLKAGEVVGPDEGGAAPVPVKVEAGNILIDRAALAGAVSARPALDSAGR